MEYNKTELTSFAKKVANAHYQYLNTMCIAEELAKSDIGMKFKNGIDENLLVEISKRYAKYARNECDIDIDCGETQECQNIINDIVSCCEDNNWFQ